MYYVGIDWADQKYDIVTVDEQGNRPIAYFTIPKSHEGFYKLLNQMSNLSSNPNEILFGIETPNNILVDFLLGFGYQLYWIQPGSMKGNRKRFRLSGARDDEFDAFVIANVVRTDLLYLRQIDFGSDLVRELRILVTDHHQLVDEQSALANRFHASVKEYYPEYSLFFRDITCPTSLSFIESYPTFNDARRLSEEQISLFLKEHGYVMRHKKADNIYQMLRQPNLIAAPIIVNTKKIKTSCLIEQLAQISKDIKFYVDKIKTVLDKHPDSEIFLSYPGVGEILAARLIAMIGDNRNLFNSANEVQSLAGCCPVTEKTGKNTRSIYFRRSCNKFYRDTIHNLAFSSLTKAKWAYSYYKKHREAGKTNAHALRCLANLHLKILFAMWKNHTKYDENIFLAQRSRIRIFKNIS